MFNTKRKDYRNIMILVLLLAIFFSLGNLIFQRNAFASSIETANHSQRQQKDKQFLYRAIDHVFPAGGIDDREGPLVAMKGIYTSVVSSIFFIDLNDPYTFIKPQFPGMGTYNQILAQGLEEKIGGNTQPVTSPQIEYVPLDEENALENPEDYDFEDYRSGIYLPDQDPNVIVSRTNIGDIVLEGIKEPKKIKFEEGKPHILIYHTHGTESYKPATEGNYHTLRQEYSVISIGKLIADGLREQGFNVIHDTTYHDYPSYNGSYGRSRATAQEILKNNPSIQVVIDLHRDGFEFPDSENMIRSNQWTHNSDTMARYYFVIGERSPNRQEVETFGRFVKAVSDQVFPGFSKPLYMKPYVLNTDLADYYALVELGSNANTIEEARKAAPYFAEVFGKALKLISQ